MPALPRPARTLLAALALGTAGAASAQGLAVFEGADLALGARLMAEHRCSSCHASKFGGDGSSVYRPAGRVNSPARLIAMVERCSTQLDLQLFPEDVVAIAAVLQRDHYRFR